MKITFLGTGAAISPGRLWSSLLVDDAILIDPSPTAPWAMKRAGADPSRLRAVLVTHAHADHAFGLPLLLAELRFRHGRDVPVAGPRGFARWTRALLRLAFADVDLPVRVLSRPRLRIGPYRLQAVPLRHTVRAQGWLVSRGGRTLACTGDTEPCAGLRRLIGAADLAVVEMTSRCRLPGHLSHDDVRALAGRVVATHVGEARLPRGVRVARDFETMRV